MSAPGDEDVPGPLSLLDDAVHLLRAMPLHAWAIWAAGTLPFAAALLYACTSLAWGRADKADAAGAATVLTALYFWMKLQHVRFCGHLWRECSASEPAARQLRVEPLRRQVILQGAGLVAVGLGSLVIIPFGWIYAWYQNLCVMEHARPRNVARAAWAQACLWPAQNHQVQALAFIGGLFIYINVVALIAVIPAAAAFITGQSGQVLRDIALAVNGPLMFFPLVLTWLVLDPLMKAVFSLRCFHGLSRHSGEDIRVGWRRSGVATAIVLVVLALLPVRAHAQAPAPSPAMQQAVEGAVPQAQLRGAVERTLQQPRFAWRLPNERKPADSELADSLRTFMKRVRDWLSRHLSRRGSRDSDADPVERRENGLVGEGLHLVPILVWGLLIVGLGMILAQVVHGVVQRRREAVGEPPPPEPVDVEPDLDDEGLTGEELPLNEWVALGDRLMTEGDFRRAARAFFLAHLALLGSAGALRLARHKTNGDYERELWLRRSIFPREHEHYADARLRFERLWYGGVPATADEAGGLRALLPAQGRAA